MESIYPLVRVTAEQLCDGINDVQDKEALITSVMNSMITTAKDVVTFRKTKRAHFGSLAFFNEIRKMIALRERAGTTGKLFSDEAEEEQIPEEELASATTPEDDFYLDDKDQYPKEIAEALEYFENKYGLDETLRLLTPVFEEAVAESMKKTSSNDIMEQTYEALVGRTLSIYDKDNVAEQMCDFFGQDSEISKAFMQSRDSLREQKRQIKDSSEGSSFGAVAAALFTWAFPLGGINVGAVASMAGMAIAKGAGGAVVIGPIAGGIYSSVYPMDTYSKEAIQNSGWLAQWLWWNGYSGEKYARIRKEKGVDGWEGPTGISLDFKEASPLQIAASGGGNPSPERTPATIIYQNENGDLILMDLAKETEALWQPPGHSPNPEGALATAKSVFKKVHSELSPEMTTGLESDGTSTKYLFPVKDADGKFSVVHDLNKVVPGTAFYTEEWALPTLGVAAPGTWGPEVDAAKDGMGAIREFCRALKRNVLPLLGEGMESERKVFEGVEGTLNRLGKLRQLAHLAGPVAKDYSNKAGWYDWVGIARSAADKVGGDGEIIPAAIDNKYAGYVQAALVNMKNNLGEIAKELTRAATLNPDEKRLTNLWALLFHDQSITTTFTSFVSPFKESHFQGTMNALNETMDQFELQIREEMSNLCKLGFNENAWGDLTDATNLKAVRELCRPMTDALVNEVLLENGTRINGFDLVMGARSMGKAIADSLLVHKEDDSGNVATSFLRAHLLESLKGISAAMKTTSEELLIRLVSNSETAMNMIRLDDFKATGKFVGQSLLKTFTGSDYFDGSVGLFKSVFTKIRAFVLDPRIMELVPSFEVSTLLHVLSVFGLGSVLSYGTIRWKTRNMSKEAYNKWWKSRSKDKSLKWLTDSQLFIIRFIDIISESKRPLWKRLFAAGWYAGKLQIKMFLASGMARVLSTYVVSPLLAHVVPYGDTSHLPVVLVGAAERWMPYLLALISHYIEYANVYLPHVAEAILRFLATKAPSVLANWCIIKVLEIATAKYYATSFDARIKYLGTDRVYITKYVDYLANWERSSDVFEQSKNQEVGVSSIIQGGFIHVIDFCFMPCVIDAEIRNHISNLRSDGGVSVRDLLTNARDIYLFDAFLGNVRPEEDKLGFVMNIYNYLGFIKPSDDSQNPRYLTPHLLMPDIGLVKGDRSLISMSEVLQASHTNDDFLTVYKAALIKQAREAIVNFLTTTFVQSPTFRTVDLVRLSQLSSNKIEEEGKVFGIWDQTNFLAPLKEEVENNNIWRDRRFVSPVTLEDIDTNMDKGNVQKVVRGLGTFLNTLSHDPTVLNYVNAMEISKLRVVLKVVDSLISELSTFETEKDLKLLRTQLAYVHRNAELLPWASNLSGAQIIEMLGNKNPQYESKLNTVIANSDVDRFEEYLYLHQTLKKKKKKDEDSDDEATPESDSTKEAYTQAMIKRKRDAARIANLMKHKEEVAKACHEFPGSYHRLRLIQNLMTILLFFEETCMPASSAIRIASTRQGKDANSLSHLLTSDVLIGSQRMTATNPFSVDLLGQSIEETVRRSEVDPIFRDSVAVIAPTIKYTKDPLDTPEEAAARERYWQNGNHKDRHGLMYKDGVGWELPL